MPKFNDLDLKNWKEIDLNMDSLWMISERKNDEKILYEYLHYVKIKK